MKTLGKVAKNILTAAFVALVLAVVFRLLLPVPVATMFAVMLFFYVLVVAEQWFGAGARQAISLIRILVRTGLAFMAFVAIRFLLGQVLGIYPVDAYDHWGTQGGFNGVFWGHAAPREITLEIVLCGLIGWVMIGWIRKQRIPKLLGVGMAILILVGVTFPLWANTWPETRQEIDKSLVKEGLRKTVSENIPLPTFGSNAYPNYNSDPLAISPNVWRMDQAGLNNHENGNERYFDLVLTGDGQFGKEGHVRPPKWWRSWKKYWVSNEPDRHVGFLYSGASHSFGPFDANLPDINNPHFNNTVREWMAQGVGTLRYEDID